MRIWKTAFTGTAGDRCEAAFNLGLVNELHPKDKVLEGLVICQQ